MFPAPLARNRWLKINFLETLGPMKNLSILAPLSLLAVFSFSATLVQAQTDVDATDVIFAAGSQSSLLTSVAGGTAPVAISVAGDSTITFSVTGTITLNGGGNYNDADGVGAAVSSSSETGYGSISGITLPNAGDLVGVFLGAGGPTGSAPTALDFVGDTSFTSLAPVLDQTFYIGDGLTGDGTGTTQTFDIPTGATELYLGISDACGYNGGPSCYSDNSGDFVVNDTVTAAVASPAPEPSSFILLGTGALGLLGAARRRIAAARA